MVAKMISDNYAGDQNSRVALISLMVSFNDRPISALYTGWSLLKLQAALEDWQASIK